jgi:hypothetical protein
MKVKILFVKFLDAKFHPSDIPKLRGYIADQFPNYTILHNHLPGGKFCYKFPKIQYRVMEKSPALIGIGEGIDVLREVFMELEELIIGDRLYQTNNCSIIMKEYDFGVSDEYLVYEFISPWMSLNQKNYRKYKSMDKFDRVNFLNHLLRENLKTISKGVDYTIPNIEEVVPTGILKQTHVNFKNRKMTAFWGNFKVNFAIPDYFALGKQGARGFGVVTKIIT